MTRLRRHLAGLLLIGPPPHDEDEAAAFHALVREGQEMRRAFEAKTAKMRTITPDDLKVRSR